MKMVDTLKDQDGLNLPVTEPYDVADGSIHPKQVFILQGVNGALDLV